MNRRIIAASIALTLVVFAIDLVLPLGVAGGVPYVAPVLLSLWSGKRSYTFTLAVAATALTVLGYFLSPRSSAAEWQIFSNRFLAIFAIWITALLGTALVRTGDELRHKSTLVRRVLNSLGEGVLITDDQLAWPGPRILFVNVAICRITGYRADELIGQTPRIFQGEETDRQTLDRIKRELSAGRPCQCELVNYRKDGSTYHAELFITPLFDAHGNRTNFVSIHRDVTARKEAEEALRRTHELNESIIKTAQNIVLVLDIEGRIVRFNRYMEELTGWRLDEVQGRDWFETFLPDQDRQRVHQMFARAISGQRTHGNVNPILTKEGREREIEWYDAPLTDGEGRLIGLLCTGHDITERMRLEREILEIASEEQRRIGQDLHDSTQQELTGLGLLAQNLADSLKAICEDIQRNGPRPPAETGILQLAELAAKVAKGISDANQHVRLLARGLVPVEVDRQGLMSALAELATATEQLHGIACVFECDEPVEVSDNSVATHLYRIAQEAATNAVKHARADTIQISLQRNNDLVTLELLDNGIGIDDQRLHAAGLGLQIMAYRTGLIDGTLEVGPRTEGGTRIRCTVPVVESRTEQALVAGRGHTITVGTET